LLNAIVQSVVKCYSPIKCLVQSVVESVE